jgi:hypothetical protein
MYQARRAVLCEGIDIKEPAMPHADRHPLATAPDRTTRPARDGRNGRDARTGRIARIGVALAAVTLLGACATSQPVVYTKESVAAAKAESVSRDIAACRGKAQAAVGLNGRSATQVAGASGRAGLIGFVGTAVGSVVAGSKDAWARARAGAAGGAAGIATKTLLEWNDPDDVYQEYVERCLGERGHDVLGWR